MAFLRERIQIHINDTFYETSEGFAETAKNLIGTYKASSVHITIPVILTFRFLFLDKRERDLKIYEKCF